MSPGGKRGEVMMGRIEIITRFTGLITVLCCGSSFFILLAAHAASGMELPEPPQDYSWVEVKELKAAFLVPAAWRFTTVKSEHKLYTISRVEQDEAGGQKTGLTILVRRKKSENAKNDCPPSSVADALFREVQRYRELERTESGTQGPFTTIRYQYVFASAGSASSREFALLAANDQTGTLYVITFEAPLALWEDAWQTAAVVLNNMILDDEV